MTAQIVEYQVNAVRSYAAEVREVLAKAPTVECEGAKEMLDAAKQNLNREIEFLEDFATEVAA